MKKNKVISIIFVLFMIVGCGSSSPKIKEIKDLSAKEISKAKQNILDMEDDLWSFYYMELTQKTVIANHESGSEQDASITYKFEDDKVVSVSYYTGFEWKPGCVYYPEESSQVDQDVVEDFEEKLKQRHIDKEELDAVMLWYYKEKQEPIDSIKAKLVGEWETSQETDDTYYSFGEDGSLAVKVSNIDFYGTYTIDEKTIFGSVDVSGDMFDMGGEYRLDGNQLIMGWGSDRVIYQRK